MPSIETARSWYPHADPIHGFDHVLRVLHMAEQLALVEGADIEIVRAAVLLHDARTDLAIGDSEQQPTTTTTPDGNNLRQNHHQHSATLARQVLENEGWPEERIAAVEHCIRAHRFRDDSEQPQTLEAKILFDADKLDAIGAVGVARAIAYAIHAGQPAYAPPSESFLHSGQCQPGEPHSAYHEYLFKLRKLKERLHTPTARAIAEERHQFMTAYFEKLAADNFVRLNQPSGP